MESAPSLNLTPAYTQWLKIQTLLKKLASLITNHNELREVKAILERLFVSLADRYGDEWMRETPDLFDKMTEEVTLARKAKKGKKPKIIKTTGKALSQMVLDMFNSESEIEDNLECLFENDTFSYGDFQLELPKRVSDRLLVQDLSTIILMLLRLRTVGFQGQQWAKPIKWFEYIQKEKGLDLIAFSSPVNVQLSNVPFCSVSTVDVPFGSVGNFFTFDIQKFMEPFSGKKMTIAMNSPFTEDILLRAVHRVDEMFEVAEKFDIHLTVFINGPNWDDAEFFQLLSKHRFLRRAHTLRRGSYFYEDCFQTGPQSIVPGSFESQLFALSNGKTDVSFANMTTGFEKKVVTRHTGSKHGGRGANRSKDKKCRKCGTTFTPRQPKHMMCKDCKFGK
jgi:Phosphorylated CTD interacting factor 1 WW domain